MLFAKTNGPEWKKINHIVAQCQKNYVMDLSGLDPYLDFVLRPLQVLRPQEVAGETFMLCWKSCLLTNLHKRSLERPF